MLTALVTLGTGLLFGYLAQRSRLCFISSLRDWLLVRDSELLWAVFGFFAAAWLAFPVAGALGLPVWGTDPTLSAGAGSVPLALVAGVLVGGLATGSGGCPLRQHVLAAQGSGDAQWWLAGFYLGAPLYALLRWLIP